MSYVRRALRWLWGRRRTAAYLLFCAGLALAFWRIDDTRAAGAVASCERGNEIRQGIRDLARDLGADPETLAIVDERFHDIDCMNIPGN